MTWLKRSGERGGWVPSERMRRVRACLLAQSELWPCGLNFSETERLCIKLAVFKMVTPPPLHSVLSTPSGLATS